MCFLQIRTAYPVSRIYTVFLFYRTGGISFMIEWIEDFTIINI